MDLFLIQASDVMNFGPGYEHISKWILTQTSAAHYFAILSILLVGMLIALVFISDRFKYSGLLFIICSIAAIFIFRGLSLYADSYNPDEGMHLANAIALSHDGRLWVATDTTTFGPVSAVIILTVHKIIGLFSPGFGISYFLLRLINILIISVSFILLLKLFESRLNRKPARVISLFYVLFFSFSWDGDLQAFNSEYVYMLFVSIALLAAYSFRHKADAFQLIMGGLACGTMPLVKLQTIPMCAALAMWSFYSILIKEHISFGKKKIKNHYALFLYIGAAALPSFLVFLYCLTYSDGLSNAFTYYILNAKARIGEHTLNQYVKYFISSVFPWLLSLAWYRNFVILVSPAIIAALYLGVIKKNKPDGNFVFAAMLLLFSIEAVTHPMTLFTHYLIFPVVPALIFLMETLVWLDAAEHERIRPPKAHIPKALGGAFRKDNVIVFCLLLLTLVPDARFYKHVSRDTVLSNKIIVGYGNPYLTQAARYIAEHTTSDDYIVVWGWEQRVLVYANRKSGTAQTDIQRLYPPYSSKNTNLYISDIHRNKPKIIIDVVAPGSFGYDDEKTSGLEAHPQVWPAIRNDYSLAAALPAPNGAAYRLYSRKSSIK